MSEEDVGVGYADCISSFLHERSITLWLTCGAFAVIVAVKRGLSCHVRTDCKVVEEIEILRTSIDVFLLLEISSSMFPWFVVVVPSHMTRDQVKP